MKIKEKMKEGWNQGRNQGIRKRNEGKKKRRIKVRNEEMWE